MRMHIELANHLVKRIDAAAGPRKRAQFVREAVEAALRYRERWALIQSGRGTISDRGHDWDENLGEWIRHQRRGDRRRVG